MPLDAELLESARAAAERIGNAEARLERLRAEHRDSVRSLHRKGATLREIAAALGLSHQRVHQLVSPGGVPPETPRREAARPRAPGRRGRRPSDPGAARSSCLFCGEEAATNLCAPCLKAARRLIAGEALDGARGLRPLFRHNRRPCGLCGRLPLAGERFAEAHGTAICLNCLGG